MPLPNYSNGTPTSPLAMGKKEKDGKDGKDESLYHIPRECPPLNLEHLNDSPQNSIDSPTILSLLNTISKELGQISSRSPSPNSPLTPSSSRIEFIAKTVDRMQISQTKILQNQADIFHQMKQYEEGVADLHDEICEMRRQFDGMWTTVVDLCMKAGEKKKTKKSKSSRSSSTLPRAQSITSGTSTRRKKSSRPRSTTDANI